MSKPWRDLSPEITNILETLDNIPENLRGQVYAEVFVKNWGGDVGKATNLLNYAKKLAISEAFSQGEIKERLPYDIHEYLYKAILEQGVTPEEAVVMAAQLFDLTEDWINEKKHLSAPKQNKLIARSFDEHSKQKSMKSKGVVTGKDLKTHSTPSAQLSRLHKGVALYDWIKGLENKVDTLSEELVEVRAVTDINTKSVSRFEDILGEAVSVDEKIQEMKSRGLKQKKVAELLNISLSSVKRKWKSPQ